MPMNSAGEIGLRGFGIGSASCPLVQAYHCMMLFSCVISHFLTLIYLNVMVRREAASRLVRRRFAERVEKKYLGPAKKLKYAINIFTIRNISS